MNKSRNKDGKFTKRASGDMFEGFPVYNDAKGYKCIWIDGKNVKIHVYVWERENGEKPKGYDIHHIDKDKGNYSLDNLQLLTHSDHQKIHAGWIMTDSEWTHKPCTGCLKVLPLSSFYPRKGYTPSAKCKQCHCEQTDKWAKKNPERRKEIGLKHYYKNKEQGGKTHARE